MTGVAAGPGGYVAVGCNTITAETSTNCVAGAWQSPDARAWTRVVLPTAAMVDGDMHVVGDGAGYVAWGGLVDPEGRVRFWASSDGSVWRTAPLIDAFDGADIGSIVRYRDEWVASGGAGGRGAIVLASPDGVTWRQLPLLDERGAAFAPGTPIWSLDTLVATSQGLVGFGPTTIDDQVMSATFRSTDGQHWSTSVDLPRGVSVTFAVAAAGGVATFWRVDSDDASLRGGWQAADGSSWTAATFNPPGVSGGMGLLTNGGGEWYGLGTEVGQPAAPWSVDRVSWLATSSVPDAAADGTEPVTDCIGGPCTEQLPRTVVYDLGGTPDGFIAVGGTHLPGGGYEAVVWVASTELAD
jgi:hypothetical protein